jgi:DNA-binding beta-propeller fold protein YncE
MPQTDLGKPKGMGLDRDGNIIVVEPHYQRINHFDTQGRLVSQWGHRGTNQAEFILPRCITQNSKGDYFVGEYTLAERVQRFGPGHEFQLSWGEPGLAPGQFNRAEGIAAGPKDRIYVCDSCNHRIQIFDSDGHFVRAHGSAGSAPGQFSYPYDIKVDSSGTQFVCEFGNSRITVFDDQDHVIEVIGSAGSRPGEFANPWSLALDSQGNLYVADSQNHRVQKLMRRKGTAVASLGESKTQLAAGPDFGASSAAVRP